MHAFYGAMLLQCRSVLRRAVANMFFKTILRILLAQLGHVAIARLFSHNARRANCRHSATNCV